jgi:cob(I)alamin adenosyltransferase
VEKEGIPRHAGSLGGNTGIPSGGRDAMLDQWRRIALRGTGGTEEDRSLSISTRQGDFGETGLADGRRISKADLRIECLGAIDELVSEMGVARAICADAEVKGWLQSIQNSLFKVGAAIGFVPEAERPPVDLDPSLLEALDRHVQRLEATKEMIKGWVSPGDLPESAALDVARAVCRRAERAAVRLHMHNALGTAAVLAYLNRLSDVLWLFGRLLELRAARDRSQPRPR